jgi:Flp pilus assembly protein TadG
MSFVRNLTRLRRDTRGATIIEFAMVSPVMCLLIVGGLDIAHTLYVGAVLQGAVQKASRDATLESGLDTTVQARLDHSVRNQVEALAGNATITIKRNYFSDFKDAAANQFEPFTDTNGNGTCDGPAGSTPGEPYEDTNNNQRWDRTGGNEGQGGAQDAVAYTVTMSYPRLFPVYGFIGGSDTTSVSATTILRNQPYADQAVAQVRNCT